MSEIKFLSKEFNLEKVLTLLSPPIQVAVRQILRKGGCIAGGFVERCLVSEFSNSTSEFWKDYFLNNHGDIDFWFESLSLLDTIANEMEESYPNLDVIHASVYRTNYARNFSFSRPLNFKTLTPIEDGDQPKRIQGVKLSLINKAVGKIEDIVANFDLYNAMCYYKDGKIFYPEKFFDLLYEKHVKIVNYSGIHRTLTWISKRHEYETVDPESRKMIIDNFAEIVNLSIDNKLLKTLTGDRIKLPSLSSILLNGFFNLPKSVCFVLCQFSKQQSHYTLGTFEKFTDYMSRPAQ